MTQEIISQRHDGHRGDAPAEITPRGLYGQEDVNKAQEDIAHGNVIHVADAFVQEIPLKQIEQRDAHGDDGQDVIDGMPTRPSLRNGFVRKTMPSAKLR